MAWSLSSARLAHGSVLERVLVLAHFDDAMHVDPREVDVIRIDRAEFAKLVHLRHRGGGRRGHERREIARRAPKAQVAEAIASTGANQREVGRESALEQIRLAVELAHFFPLLDHGAESGWSVE